MGFYVFIALLVILISLNVLKLANSGLNMVGTMFLLMTVVCVASTGEDLVRKAGYIAEDARMELAATQVSLAEVARRQVQPQDTVVKSLLLSGDRSAAPDAILRAYDSPQPFTDAERKAKVAAIVKVSDVRQTDLRTKHKLLQAEYADYVKGDWVMLALVRWFNHPATIPNIE